MAHQLKKRSEISKDLTWDLTGIFKTETDFENALEEFVESVDSF